VDYRSLRGSSTQASAGRYPRPSQNAGPEMELTLPDYLSLLRKYWRSIVAITLVAISLAATYCVLVQPTYTSKASLFFSVNSANSASDLKAGSSYAESQVQSFAKVARTDIVLQPVIDKLGLATTPGQLAEQVTVTVPTKTAALDLAVVANSPESAAQVAQAISERLVTTIDQLSPPSPDGAKSVTATIITPAQLPVSPTTPNTMQNLTLGAMLGLLMGAGLAIVRDMLNLSIRSERDIERVTEIPVIGVVPEDDDAVRNPLVLHADPHSQRAEAYRSLRTNLQFLGLDRGKRSIVVTSSVPGEGKTTTAINTASTLAAAGERVLLIDADLRRPKVARYLSVEGGVGLTTVLIGEAQLGDVVQPCGVNDLHVVAAGALPPNPAELLGLPQMQQLLAEASRRYDTVIIDAPPLLPVTDAAVLSRITDGTLVVVGSSIARRPELAKALEALERVDTRILGLLLTRARGHDAGHYRYDYSYQPTTREQGPVIEQISDAHEPPARAARRSDSWAVVG